MLPKLYGAKETNFEHNGIGILVDTISCLVVEEINGMYELELAYKAGSFLSKLLVEDNIIKAKANDEHDPQLFRIYYVSEEINGTITVRAEHISYDLRGNFLESIMLTNVNCQEAGRQMLNNLAEPTNFTFKSNIEHISNYNISRCNGLEAIKGKRGSLVDTFGNGPKLIRDNFNISLVKDRGKNNNVLISYRKNMTGYKRELDLTNLVTKIYPFALKQVEETSVEELIVLPERFLVSKNYNKYSKGKIASLDYSSEESVKDVKSLRTLAEKWFNDTKQDEPDINYQIEFVNLYKTDNYKNLGLENLENVCLDDTVTIRDYRFGLDVEARVIKTVYNTLNEKYEKIELGKFKDSLKLNDNELEDKVDNSIQQVKNMLVRFEVLDDKIVGEVSKLDGDIKANTTLIQQTTDAITQVAKDVEGNTSLINQTANEINLELSKKTDKNSIISAINMSSEGIKIQSKNIDLTGLVTIYDLEENGRTEIHGGNISTRTITADKLKVGTITANEIASNTITASEIATGAITADKIKTGSISVDMITQSSTNPVLKLFGNSCAIDATQYMGQGIGNAIRLKKDDSNYLYVGNGEIALYCTGSDNNESALCTFDGNSYSFNMDTKGGFLSLNSGVFYNNNKLAYENHTHSGYASSSHTHSGYASSSHTHSDYLPKESTSICLSGSHSPYYTNTYNCGWSSQRWQQVSAQNGYFDNSYLFAVDNPVATVSTLNLDNVIDDIIIEDSTTIQRSGFNDKLVINVNALKENDNGHLFISEDDGGNVVVNEGNLLALALQEIKKIKEKNSILEYKVEELNLRLNALIELINNK